MTTRHRVLLTLLAAATLAASMLVACGPPTGESRLTVHNRTETAIVFTSGSTRNFVEACATETFSWRGYWGKTTGEDTPIAGAVSAGSISYGPAAEGFVVVTYVIAAPGSVRGYTSQPEVPDPLPACGGAFAPTPEPTPEPSRTPRPTDPPVEYRPELVGVVLEAVPTTDRVTTYRLEGGSEVVATPNLRYLGGMNPVAGDLLLTGGRPRPWIDRALPATPGSALPEGCFLLDGPASADETHVFVRRSTSDGPAVIAIPKSADWSGPDESGFETLLDVEGICLNTDGEAFATP